MKKNLFISFILFLIIKYSLRTLVKKYKYHEAGSLMELLPLMIAALIISFISSKIIETENFRSVYLKLSFASILGLFTAKTILFFQWYWIIAPEYRNVSGDMEEGLAWTVFEGLFGAFEILILFLVSVLMIKVISERKS